MKPISSAIIGKDGIIGRAFFQYHSRFYPDLCAAGREDLDLGKPDLKFLKQECSWAIIAAGWGTPQRCVDNPALARKLDYDGVLNLSRMLAKRGVTPIFFSTTYIFDGKESLYFPNSPASPTNEYGALHADREKRLMEELDGNCLIIRLSRVLGERSLVHEMCEQLLKKQIIHAAVDQVLYLVTTSDIVDGVTALQQANKRGIFHICQDEGITRYELARYLAKELFLSEALVHPIKLKEVSRIGRPERIKMLSSIKVRPWKEGVDAILKQYRVVFNMEC